MSGDVQPRKRKDKKRKKDDLGLEEPRGTAAALGEGDVFIHSQLEHGTGGHWCAKIIFFSLLAVLITLIGLIILENRGLSELEANAVESRYSGVLEGWLEDAPDDDHHDAHTLELTHHDDDDDDVHHDDNYQLKEDHDDDDDEGYDDEDEDADPDDDDNEEHDNNEDLDNKQNVDSDEDSDERLEDNDDYELQDEDNDEDEPQDEDNDDDEHGLDNEEDDDEQYSNDNYQEDDQSGELNENENEDDENEDEDKYYSHYEVDENDEDNDESNEIDNDADTVPNYNDDAESEEANENEDENEHEEEESHDDEDVEVEKLEKEDPDEEPISTELPALPEDDDDDDDDKADDDDSDKDDDQDGGDLTEGESDKDDDEYLENDNIDEPDVEHIIAPPGKPLLEVEEEVSSEQPPDTLAEEEEYEKRQEELRREEEQSSHMWLKLTVGGALLVATHAVMRRATRTRDSPDDDDEEPAVREDTPLTDRRLTLIPEQHAKHVPVTRVVEEIPRPSVDKVVESAASIIKPVLVKKQESDEEEERYSDEEIEEPQEIEVTKGDNKELYSDEEEEAEIDEEVIEEPKHTTKQSAPVVESKPIPLPEPEEEEEIEEDVEIIDDEQLEEDLEEEDEEEISDVDDAELLTRLEAKYGRLPEPERPGQKYYKDGGNSIDDDWPGEPSDAYWRDQLDSAERELFQGSWSAALARASDEALQNSGRARWIIARALDLTAEAQRDNTVLSRAISAYLNLLKMNERLSDKKLLQVTERTLDRIQFRGNYLNAEPVYRLLIRRFPNDPAYRNNLTISFLMANRADLAEDVLKETLKRWPDDRLALAHYGFVLKTKHNRYEEAAEAFRKALEGDTGPANEARFYYHYGDSLLLLSRPAEAHEVHKRGAKLGHFLSPAQRSLYNVPRLKSSPWWKIEETPYSNLARALENSWRQILKEAEAAKASYEKEKEGLKERGEWSQLDLFVRGREIPKRCERAPVTCSIVKSEVAAAGCRRGQVKFSAMAAGTHVRAHVGPTNCRLRMHLGLSNTKDTYIRVDQEIRQWQVGKTFLFDDSFEHEVWHNGTGTRLVLIVDVWHPDLSAAERRQLPAI